jgi:hypothetical protein
MLKYLESFYYSLCRPECECGPEDNTHHLLNKENDELFQDAFYKLLDGKHLNSNENNIIDGSLYTEYCATIYCDGINFEQFSNYDKTKFLIFKYHSKNNLNNDKNNINNDKNEVLKNEVLKLEVFVKCIDIASIRESNSNFIYLDCPDNYLILERDVKFVNIGKNTYKIIKRS